MGCGWRSRSPGRPRGDPTTRGGRRSGSGERSFSAARAVSCGDILFAILDGLTGDAHKCRDQRAASAAVRRTLVDRVVRRRAVIALLAADPADALVADSHRGGDLPIG